MKCYDVEQKLMDIVSGALPATALADCKQHIADCVACGEAMHGVEGLARLRRRAPETVPADLFETVSARVKPRADRRRGDRRFWMGTGLGGAVAVSLFASALTLGWVQIPAHSPAPDATEFMVTLSETRDLNIAIETDQALADARITVMLTGGVELSGYTGQRDLSWNTDLVAGVNRLTLPVKAIDPSGGRVIVQLTHPDTEQVLVVGVKADA